MNAPITDFEIQDYRENQYRNASVMRLTSVLQWKNTRTIENTHKGNSLRLRVIRKSEWYFLFGLH